MPTPIYVVDAFASAPFRGNPAGVVITDRPVAPALMRGIAAEMKHSETAFAVKQDDDYALRWLTPEAEVELCGHATLATAHVLWETGRVKTTDAIRFHTKSGVLVARNLDGVTIELDFPALVPVLFAAPFDLAPALGVPVLETWRSRDDVLVLTRGEKYVSDARPDLGLLKSLPVRGVILTGVCEDRSVDFVSRFFAPAVGVDEDPVTGSAHCALAPFWAARLGKTKLQASQLSARRGSLEVELVGDRVKLRGRALTILRGGARDLMLTIVIGNKNRSSSAWSIADAFFTPVATRFRSYGVTIEDPIARAYCEMLLADPAFLAWEAGAIAENDPP